MFVAKFNPFSNQFVWAQWAGGRSGDYASALAVSGTSVYVAGSFESPTAGLGATTLTNPSPNRGDPGFLASLTDATLTATAAGQALAHAQLFPNPARRTATLRLPARATPAPLTLTDALGRAVRHYPAPVGIEAALDLRGRPGPAPGGGVGVGAVARVVVLGAPSRRRWSSAAPTKRPLNSSGLFVAISLWLKPSRTSVLPSTKSMKSA